VIQLKDAIVIIETILNTPIEDVVKVGIPVTWTSLSHLLIITEIEHKYEIWFTDEEIVQAITLKRLLELIGEKTS